MIVSVCAPVFGYLTFIIWKVVYAQVRLAQYEYGAKKYIRELEADKLKPGLCCEEVKGIELKIRNLKEAIYERRMDALHVI